MKQRERKFKLGDVIKSAYLRTHELIVEIHCVGGQYTYVTMYIDGPADGMNSTVFCNDTDMRNLNYTVLYNLFDRR